MSKDTAVRRGGTGRVVVEGLENRTLLTGDLKWALPVGAIEDAVASDGQGNAYVVGRFTGTVDFNPSRHRTVNLTAENAGGDMFAARFLADGRLLWAVRLGSAASAPVPKAVVLAQLSGATGSTVWIGGTFSGTVDFDPSDSANADVTSNGGTDLFMLGLTETGAFRLASKVGGTLNESSAGIALDGLGRLYLAGTVTGGANLTSVAAQFTGKGRFIATRSFSTLGVDVVTTAIAADGQGDFFMAGTVSGDFDFAPANPAGRVRGPAAFILKLDPPGAFEWVGPITNTVINSIATDRSAVNGPYNVALAGAFTGQPDFNFMSKRTSGLVSAGGTDAFVVKYDANGNILYGQQMGGAGNDVANSVDMDSGGSAYVGGQFEGVSAFPRGATLTSRGNTDGFAAKYSITGRQLYLAQFGGTGADGVRSVAVAQGADLFVSGPLRAVGNYDPFGGVFNLQPIQGHAEDFFLLRLD